MSAAPAPQALTPDDLLAMVRRSGQRFQRREVTAAREDRSGFAPRAVIVPASGDGPAAPPEPQPEPRPAPRPAPETAPAPAAASFIPAPQPPAIDLVAERRAAWAEGHAEAMKQIETARAEAREAALAEARTQATEEVGEARDAFAAALARLAQAEHQMTEDLTAKLEQAVRILASKRAGQKIEEAPRPFLRRIEKLTREIAQAAEETVVMMNPGDLVAIQPHIKGFSPLAKARLSPDPRLGRGDLRIKMGEITFSDVIAERENGSLA